MNYQDKWNLTPVYISAILLAVMMMQGCYALNSASTNVSVKVSPDGTCQAEYSSNKEQVGLEASVCGGSVRVDKAGSSEAIAAGSLANQLELIRLIERLMNYKPVPGPAVPIK